MVSYVMMGAVDAGLELSSLFFFSGIEDDGREKGEKDDLVEGKWVLLCHFVFLFF